MNRLQLGTISTLVLCLLVGALLPAHADLKSAPLNVNPTSGLFNIPIAAVVDKDQVVVGIHDARFDEGGDKEDGSALLLLGVAPDVELALFGTDVDGAGVTLNGQYLLSANSGTSVAVGIQNITLHRGKQHWPDGKVDDLAGYLVVTHALDTGEANPLRLHVGGGTGRFDGLFGGIDFGLGRNLQLMGEWDGQETNAAARWTVYRRADGGESFETRLVGALIDMREASIGLEFSWKQ